MKTLEDNLFNKQDALLEETEQIKLNELRKNR